MVKSELDRMGTKQGSKDAAKERELARLIATVKRDKSKGRKLFAVNDPTGGDDYYKTELGAKRAKAEEKAVYYDDGSLKSIIKVYPDIDEIDLRLIVGWLENRENPFMSLSHSYSAYPYKWLKDIEELFRVDREDVEKL